MEMLNGYDTDELSSEESNKEILEMEEKEINLRCVRQVYLITYSQTDEVRFPSRKSFADAVLFSFNDTPAKVVQWWCCLEKHSSNVAFLFIFRLFTPTITVHGNTSQSVGHPDLANYHQPRTTLASLAKHFRPRKTPSCAAHTDYTSDKDFETTDDKISETNAKGAKRKKKRISSYEMSEIIVA